MSQEAVIEEETPAAGATQHQDANLALLVARGFRLLL
jgi:hypothetical protein